MSVLCLMTAGCLTYAPLKALDLLYIIEHITPVASTLQCGCDSVLLEFGSQVLQ